MSTDRRATRESSVTTSGVGKWYSLDLTAAVAGWVSGSVANQGVLLRAPSTSSTALYYFASAESGNATLRPRLVVKYR